MSRRNSTGRAVSKTRVANSLQNPSLKIERDAEMRGKLNRRSVRAAYKALMAGFEQIPSKEDMFIERTVKEWIWEYLLQHCPNLALIKALVEAYPIPDSSMRLKRMLLLKSLSFDVSEDIISGRTLDAVSGLMELNRVDGRADQFLISGVGSSTHIPGRKEVGTSNEVRDSRSICLSLKDLHVAVKVECTIMHLREEADDWPKFYEALEMHWGEYIQDTEEQDDDGNTSTTEELRKELRDVRKQPELRHALLLKYTRPFVKRMLKSFIADAWRALGPSFLDGVMDNLAKGLYVPSGQMDPLGEGQTAEKTLKGSSDGIRPGLLVSEILGEHNRKQHQQRKKSSSVLHTEYEKAHFQANFHEKVKESKKKAARRRTLTSATADVPLLVVSEPPQSLSAAPQTGKLIENLSSVPMDEEEAPMAGISNAEGMVLRPEKASSNEYKNGMRPAGQGDASAEARSKCDLLPQEEEPSCPSPPPWIESPSRIAGGLGVTSRSKRRKLAASCLDDISSSKVVLSSGHVQDQVGIETPEILKAQFELKRGQAQLNNAVKDPLPEALKIAEEAAKIIEPRLHNLNPTDEILPRNNGKDKGNVSTTTRLLPPRIGGSGVEQKDRRERVQMNLMDRNPTAQTFEWETNDEVADSSDANSLPSSRQARLPRLETRQRVQLVRGKAGHSGLRRRRTRWTREEENILKKEVERYGKGRWKYILEKHRNVFENRTEVDLKDKWRNIERRDGIL